MRSIKTFLHSMWLPLFVQCLVGAQSAQAAGLGGMNLREQQSVAEFIAFDAPQARPFNLTYSPSTCGSSHEKINHPEITPKLNALLEKYYQVEARRQNSKMMIQEIDDVIRLTKFASILDCRDRVASSGEFNYSVNFADVEPKGTGDLLMWIDHDLKQSGKQDLILNFNINPDIGETIPAYIHELVHICRAPERRKIDTRMATLGKNLTKEEEHIVYNWMQFAWEKPGKLPPETVSKLQEFQSARANVFRNQILGEIEGNYVQQLAYAELPKYVQNPKGLCSSYNIDIYKREKAIQDGSFAQRIINLYVGNRARFLDDDKAPPSLRDYKDADLRLGGFNMRPLHPALKKSIEALGIKVIDQEE